MSVLFFPCLKLSQYVYDDVFLFCIVFSLYIFLLTELAERLDPVVSYGWGSCLDVLLCCCTGLRRSDRSPRPAEVPECGQSNGHIIPTHIESDVHLNKTLPIENYIDVHTELCGLQARQSAPYISPKSPFFVLFVSIPPRLGRGPPAVSLHP